MLNDDPPDWLNAAWVRAHGTLNPVHSSVLLFSFLNFNPTRIHEHTPV